VSVMWSERRRPAIDRAAALRTDWRRFSRLVGKHRANTFIRQRSSKTGYMLLHYLVKLNRKMLQLGRVQQLTGHITPILKFLHWLKVNERIEYKPLSHTYKVLTTAQPSYLHNLISFQLSRIPRSSSVVTLSRPPTISLKITDRLFRYASPRIWINFKIHSVSLTILVLIHLKLCVGYIIVWSDIHECNKCIPRETMV